MLWALREVQRSYALRVSAERVEHDAITVAEVDGRQRHGARGGAVANPDPPSQQAVQRCAVVGVSSRYRKLGENSASELMTGFSDRHTSDS